MNRELAILLTLVVYNLALVAIGLWAQRRTRDNADFYLGGRRLGALVAAVSASASSSSAWTLLGVSGAAYAWGLSALWLFPATVSGFLINWLWVAPRMLTHTRGTGAVTLTEMIAGRPGGALYTLIVRVAAAIVLFSFLFYIAAQFQAAGNAFANAFGLPMSAAVLTGAVIVLAYTLLGGFWAVSVTDTLQGLLMALTAVVLPLAALATVGGWDALLAGLAADGDRTVLLPTGSHAGIAAIGFVLGTLGIGLGYPGQPHVLNRFMALRDERALRQARVIAIAWAVLVYAGMLLLGLCGRVLTAELPAGEQIFFAVTGQIFPPVIAGVMIAAVLSAIMSTADSQLLVAASSVSHDWRLGRGAGSGAALSHSRLVVGALSAAAVAVALFAPDTIFRRVLFAWHAIGSAFGPIVIVRLAGYGIAPAAVLGTILTGFTLTVVLHWFPDGPGDAWERLVPLVAAAAVAVAGRRPR